MHSRTWTLACLLLSTFSALCHGEYQRICYMADWSNRREASFSVSDIDVTMCTHVILAFASIESDFNSLTPLSPDAAVQGGTYQQLSALRNSNPQLKIILAVGGWNHGSGPFVEVVSNAGRMDIFVINVINYIRAINFDGVDIDWEWPTQRGSPPEDRERFSVLLEKLRQRINTESAETRRAPLLLSIAVGASKYIIDSSYQVDRISRAVDFLSVMTYDLNLSRGSRLLHHAPLHSRPGDPDEEQENSVEYSINYWLNKGAPRSKVMMGLPFYGRFYKLLSPLWTRLYDNAAGTSSSSSYYQICQYAKNSSWTRVFDDVSKVPHIYNNDEWIGYDDVESMELKVRFIREKGLGGAMIWDVGQDDFNGTFCNQGRYPLLSKVTEVLTASKDDCDPGTYGNLDVIGCTPCPVGFYQSQRGRTTCLPCGEGKITYVEGATNQYWCIDSCPVGQEFDYVERRCNECYKSYFRSDLLSAYCQRCPFGYTTMTTGAVTCVLVPDGVPVPEILKAIYHFTMTFDTVKCDNKEVVVGAITAGIWRVMTDASISWVDLCSRGCDNVKTVQVEGCEDGGGSNRRRRKREGHLVTLTVRAVVENVPEALSPTPGTAGNVTRTLDSVLTELFSNKDIFQALEIYGIQYRGLTERRVEKICNKSGIVFTDGECVPCGAGSYKQTTSRTCVLCPVGQYQDETGQDACKPCPGPTSTLDTGVDSADKCLSPCTMNASFCEHEGECQWDRETLTVSCLCSEPYFGERCERILVSSKSSLGPIIGGIVGGLGSLAFIVIVMILCIISQRRSKRRPNYHSNDVMFAPSVMNADYLQTPTIIAADPYYFDNPMMFSAPPRERGGSKTPKIVQLSDSESDTPLPRVPKRDVATTASSQPNGQRSSNISVIEVQSTGTEGDATTAESNKIDEPSSSVTTVQVNKNIATTKTTDSSNKQQFRRL